MRMLLSAGPYSLPTWNEYSPTDCQIRLSQAHPSLLAAYSLITYVHCLLIDNKCVFSFVCVCGCYHYSNSLWRIDLCMCSSIPYHLIEEMTVVGERWRREGDTNLSNFSSCMVFCEVERI